MHRSLSSSFRRFQALLWLLLPLLLLGCDSIEVKKQANDFDDIIKSYEASLRWGDLTDLYKTLGPEQAAMSDIPDNLDNIKVTKVERIVSPGVNGDEGIATLKIHYLFRDQQIVKKLIDKQTWHHFEDKGWLRTNPIPNFQ